jgi:hypothetical protein
MAHGRDYHMFDFDVRNRERLLEVQGPTWREADVERERLWLGRFAKALEGNADEHLRTLCPVTWKVMELALRSGVLRRYVDDGEDDLVQPTHVRDMTKCFVGPAFRRHAEASSVGEPTEPAAPEVFRERQLKTHCGYLLHVQEARRAVAHGHWDDFVEACERHMALARPAVKNAGLGLDLELLLQAAREESPDWSERADSLRADARGQGPWVKGPPRHLLGLMGLTVEDPDTCAWALQFLRTDYGLDFTAVAGAIGRLKANLTEHSEPEGGDPTQQAVHCALFLREDGLEIDLRLCFIDPTTPRSQIRSEDVYHAEGTLQEVLQDLEGYARFSVVFRVPDGPNEAEPQVLPPPERVPAALDALWWCGDAGAPSRFFAFVLDLPFPMSDGTIGTWQKQAGAPLLVPLSLSTQSET